LALAKQAEVVLLYLGLDELAETEGLDRTDMRMRQNQIDLLQALSDVQPNIVVVFSGGAAVEVSWLHLCKGLLNGYLGGQAGASAMTSVLTGEANPSGKLAESWPLQYEDIPNRRYYPGTEKTAEYREGIFVGYRYFETVNKPVRFPFGYGLSYTTFSYSALKADANSARFTLTNTGPVAGAEIAQLYVTAEQSHLYRAARELKGFVKVFLEPGGSTEVTIQLDDQAFRVFNPASNRFEVEGGTYLVQIGASVSDIKLFTAVDIPGSAGAVSLNPAPLPSYYSGHVENVSEDEFGALLERRLPPRHWKRNQPLGLNDTFSQLFYARGWVGRLVYGILTRLINHAAKKGKPDLNLLFIYNMPFRGAAKMMGGMVDIHMTEGMLSIFNGHFFKGLSRLVGAFFQKRQAAKQTQNLLAGAKAAHRVRNQGDTA
jgi:beta-glucosidase